MNGRRSRHSIVILAGVLATLAVAPTSDVASRLSSVRIGAPGQVSVASSSRRVVAVGDIHGAFDSITAILRETGLIDEQLHWSGGDTILVQTGDFTDRGARERDCMDLLMRLQDEAQAQGGEVIVLLANHEVMNLITVVRDVSPEAYATYVVDDSSERRDDSWKAYRELFTERARAAGTSVPAFDGEARHIWEKQHPLGFIDRMEALGPDGTYGKWLRGLPTAARVGDALFMHAGVSPELADKTVEEINRTVWEEIERYDYIRREMVRRDWITADATINELVPTAHVESAQLRDRLSRRPNPREERFVQQLESVVDIPRWQLLTANGFLWFRGYAMWTEATDRAIVDEILRKQQVSRIVVAHTTQVDGIMKARFDGGVFLIDTGMLTEHYGGRPSALEIVDGLYTAVYVGERVQLHPRSAGVTELPQAPFASRFQPGRHAGYATP